ncbi:hypothetical protein [Rhizobium leguminosarum]|uniref:hypothetical protein n=1 Tax=Rhizobium leguminosarum TaxID=384 RepID=UPI001441AF95|nr:hypothetical protein [Rhizobium leguminosarum]NKJ77780.1 hypothetical protein [Rhizobium leguminosarum bv. viciae]
MGVRPTVRQARGDRVLNAETGLHVLWKPTRQYDGDRADQAMTIAPAAPTANHSPVAGGRGMAKWTKEDDEVLVTAVGSGLPPSKIDIPGHSSGSIYTRMSRLGLYTDRFISEKSDTFALRKCLMCERAFGSEHIGNRICTQCKELPCYRAA